jgi:alpha-beta hydrolase superfamily lysophospholipase
MCSFRTSKNLERGGTSRELVVMLHGFAGSPQGLHYVRKIVVHEKPDADVFVPSLPTHILSMADPIVIVQTLLSDVTKLWQQRMEWLMDQYTEDKALYPYARFSFVGHSNGTYLLARALQEYPRCRFERVVFGSSVVNRHYDWAKIAGNKQIKEVLNYVATADWVVACFPKALQTMHWQDLGSAGHDGFVPPICEAPCHAVGAAGVLCDGGGQVVGE